MIRLAAFIASLLLASGAVASAEPLQLAVAKASVVTDRITNQKSLSLELTPRRGSAEWHFRDCRLLWQK